MTREEGDDEVAMTRCAMPMPAVLHNRRAATTSVREEEDRGRKEEGRLGSEVLAGSEVVSDGGWERGERRRVWMATW